jgi:D-alanyl-D-alanine carboxypeptidase
MKNRFIPIFAIAVLTAAGLAQETGVSLPDTPAGHQVKAYVQAYNAGEADMKEFIATCVAKEALRETPAEARLERYKQMREMMGVIELRKVVESRGSFMSVLAKTTNGPPVRMDFEFEPNEPFGLLGIRIEALDEGGEEGPAEAAKGSDAELVAAVKEYGEQIAQADEFSGVILIAKGGKPIFEKAYGYADREKKVLNRVDTKFNLGSINKSFTSRAIRQLVAAGKLGLDDTIGKFLPDYPNKDAASKVKVRHLLEMSGGVGDFFGERYRATPKEKIRTLEDYLLLFADKLLEFEPGTKRVYSNGGYIILGLIVAKASGEDYYDYVREHIFKPAGMSDTFWPPKDADVPNRALGYMRDGAKWVPNYDTLPGRGSSAGGGYSTARDLFKYVVALDNGTLKATDEEIRGGMGIAGGAPGLNAMLEWDPGRGYVIVVVSNFGPPSAERLGRQLRAWLPRGTRP